MDERERRRQQLNWLVGLDRFDQIQDESRLADKTRADTQADEQSENWRRRQRQMMTTAAY